MIVCYVYGEMVDDNGRQFWLRYMAPTEDAQAAANQATQGWMGLRIRGLEVFVVEQDEQPHHFMVGATEYYPVGTRPSA